ncbi:zinc chelation protein SecC [Sulfurovum sp. bin170]|uniref:YchJ family protein n=1 Tax=Sulfurovum sp. bin170 TaxID=2695268 RepID=UPI0013DFA28A|nr:YchJ family metal-binding protein [Sulfurovum sp. bin170]NEW61040.1 zinc chelation protein SecC [Sulfurovum sp. bin170]
MKKTSPNAPCPCGSHKKYKKCCAIYHKGTKPKTALLLMKSRYSAYAVGDSSYIIKTTHPDNPDYSDDKQSIDSFCQHSDFLGLEIMEFVDREREAFVTFRARLGSGDMVERSRFLRVDGCWLYVDGI